MGKSSLDTGNISFRFTKIASRYRRRLNAPQKESYKNPVDNAAGDIRVGVYKLGRLLKGKKDLFPFGPNVFLFVLLGAFAELGMTTKNDRNRARLIAKELQYADEHNVPPDYLIGFIHQVGGRKGIERLRAVPSPVPEALSSKKREGRTAGVKGSSKRAATPKRRRDKASTASRPRASQRKWRRS